ncbi:Nucleobindin-2 [Blattella germanica]|nr:Nucleobindin-2 [Blattella germanica]
MNVFKGVQEVLFLLIFLAILQDSVSPPVTQKKKGHEDNKIEEETEDPNNELLIEYNRYLKEVVSALESDPEFKAKLEKAEESDIRSGRIASELEHVDHRVRSKLDEIKRTELERLRHLATKEFELKNGIDTDHLKIPEHLDHTNPHTFEIEDLRKLILKTTADLAEADRKRREEFKEYEMQKEFEKQEKLKDLDEEHKKELLHEIEEKEKKHKEHQPLHHPGSKQQLEEVWEKQDHMESQEFNPKTFFHLHGEKLYSNRENIFEEFLAQTQKPEFEKDSGWEGIDETQVYTQEEYKEFERRRQEEIQRLIAQGVVSDHFILYMHVITA